MKYRLFVKLGLPLLSSTLVLPLLPLQFPALLLSKFLVRAPARRLHTLLTFASDAHSSQSQAVFIPGIHDSEDVLTIVVLGATGDLAKKLTFPALFALYTENFMPKRFHIVGVGTRALVYMLLMNYQSC
jgi:hypothetical protein